ncbi:MAG TPA: hypothetical protein PLK75_12845, partial [Bacteroidales bacterium]|nr:hypothetical protein [Bacteroidales bacterium]
MKVNVVIELVGLCLTGAGLFFKVRLQKYFIVFAGLLLITGGFVYEANWIAVALCLLFGAFVTLNFVKTRRSFKEVRVVEIPLDDIYLNEFLRYYSKSIYNIFPFFELFETHKAFLLVREMNVAGVLLTVQEGDVLNIDVD